MEIKTIETENKLKPMFEWQGDAYGFIFLK